jgi:hypothetical protein
MSHTHKEPKRVGSSAQHKVSRIKLTDLGLQTAKFHAASCHLLLREAAQLVLALCVIGEGAGRCGFAMEASTDSGSTALLRASGIAPVMARVEAR